MAYPGSVETSYWGHYDRIADLNIHLNIFEKMWAAWYAYMQNDVLATGTIRVKKHEDDGTQG